jgi:glycerol kinase
VIDQGTSSTKVLIYSEIEGSLSRKPVTTYQIPLKTIKPQPGWFEQCPSEIIQNIFKCLNKLDFKPVSCSIVNQRESVLAWDPESGIPLSNLICRPHLNFSMVGPQD